MKRLSATLAEIWQTPAGHAGKVYTPELKQADPGQYFQAWREGEQSLLPGIVFPTSLASNGSIDLDQIPPSWYPGDRLVLWGPLGHGFSLPSGVNLVFIVSSKPDISRLKPVAELAIAKGLSVSLFVEKFEPGYWHNGLPAAIEIQALSDLSGGVSQPGFFAAEVDASNHPSVSELVSRQIPKILHQCQGQVLVRTAMPCIGIAECGVCAIKTKKGWRYACKDGPVFSFEDLFDVAA